MCPLLLRPGELTLNDLRRVASRPIRVSLPSGWSEVVGAGADAVVRIVGGGEPAYGINTGFGRLARTRIPEDQLDLLQRNLVLSHAVGVGRPLPPGVVRMILALKISSLARGHSGVRPQLVEALVALLDAELLPAVPEKGSVGASGDLAPLAHLSLPILGLGEVMVGPERVSGEEALRRLGLEPLELRAKEGLALLNGTQVSTALALYNLFRIEGLLRTAVVSGALSVDAAAGSVKPFDPRIHELRGHRGQVDVAAAFRLLLEGSEINLSHRDCGKVQDPYSLRCQPQVMGACLDQLRHAAEVLRVEANGVSDNPLVFPDTDEILSGGNFHGEPVAFAADGLALAVAEIGALAERRIALLIDASLSGLPPFLVKDGGVNSGFMIAHVTAASLASENKSLAHPASVDSLPTSANQEDHVSMSTFAARRLGEMVENTRTILAIELLAAAQGVEFHAPHPTSPRLAAVLAAVRERVPHYDLDRLFAPDIEAIAEAVDRGVFAEDCPLPPLE